jgi:hypothetical protein
MLSVEMEKLIIKLTIMFILFTFIFLYNFISQYNKNNRLKKHIAYLERELGYDIAYLERELGESGVTIRTAYFRDIVPMHSFRIFFNRSNDSMTDKDLLSKIYWPQMNGKIKDIDNVIKTWKKRTVKNIRG